MFKEGKQKGETNDKNMQKEIYISTRITKINHSKTNIFKEKCDKKNIFTKIVSENK